MSILFLKCVKKSRLEPKSFFGNTKLLLDTYLLRKIFIQSDSIKNKHAFTDHKVRALNKRDKN